MVTPPATVSDAPAAPRFPSPDGSRCLRCDYDLRGQAADGRCPECGLPVRRSTAAPDELHLAPAGWLKGLWIGAAAVLAAQVVYAAWIVFGAWLNLDYRVALALYDLIVVTFAVGVWLLTRSQRRFRPSGPALRWLLRLLTGPLVASCALETAGFLTGNMTYFAAAGLANYAVVFLLLLLFIHLARLARRAKAARLAGQCVRAGLGLTASIVLTAGLGRAETAHWFRAGTPPQASLVAGCLIVAFYLWAMVALAWFAAVFRRVWRASRAGA
jgi:hypothetical protein